MKNKLLLIMAILVLSVFAAFGQESENSAETASTDQVAAGAVSDSDKAPAQSDMSGLTDKEAAYAGKLTDKGIDISDRHSMKKIFAGNLAGGIVCAALGVWFIPMGVGLLGYGLYGALVLNAYGVADYVPESNAPFIAAAAVGGIFLLAGLILAPCSAIGFSGAAKTKKIYEKTAKEKLFAFIRRVGIGGGYDYEHKEVTMAMSVRL